MNKILPIIKKTFNAFGLDIIRLRENSESLYSYQFGLNSTLGNKIQKFENQNFNSISESSKMFLNAMDPSSKVIFDIGSNTGLFSLIISNKIDLEKIYLFEPVTEYIEFSKIRLPKDSRFIFNNVGCSDQDGHLDLFMDNNNLGWNTVVSEKSNPSMEKRKISCIRLSEYIKDHKLTNIDAIKIDVEGHEFYILKDLYLILNSLEKLPVILVEIGWGKNNPMYKELVSLLKQYFDLGYKPVDLSYDQTFDVILQPL